MNTDFKHLIMLMGTSAAPVECPTCDDWRRVEKELGLRFPEDYKAFVSMYGTCRVMGSILLYNPAEGALFPLSHEGLVTGGGKGGLSYEDLKWVVKHSPLQEDVVFYPEKNGWLHFGSVDDGFLFWSNTAAPPEEWVIRVTDFEEAQYFNTGFTAFMSAFIAGDLDLLGMAADTYGPPAYRQLG